MRSLEFSRDAVESFRGLSDREWFITNLTVRARLPGLRRASEGGRIRAKLMPAQVELQKAIEKYRDPATGGVSLLSTMARRSGKTALLLMHGVRQLVESPGGFRGTIMLHRDDVTRRTRFEFERMVESLPDFLRPAVDLSNAKEITFPELDGRLFVATAESKGFGGGDDLHYALVDEVPRWSETFCSELLDDIESAATPDARIYMNGAPECGPEHPFAQKWEAGVYPKVVIPAWYAVEYHVGPRNEWGDLEPLDGDEEHIKGLGAQASYVRWRRWRLVKFSGSRMARLMKFRQKYPEFEGHLFNDLGGNPAMDPELIQGSLDAIQEFQRTHGEPERVVRLRRAA